MTAERANATGARLLGVLLVVVGVVLAPPAVGGLLARDGTLDDLLARRLVLAGDFALVLAGVLLAVRGPRLRPGLLATGFVIGAAMLAVGVLGRVRGSSAIPGADPIPAVPVREPDELCEWLADVENPYFGNSVLERRVERLAAAEESGDPAEIVLALEFYAASLLNEGRNEEAVEALERARDLVRSRGVGDLTAVCTRLAVAHMRTGEVTHCVGDHNPESCLFPIQAGGVWSDVTAAEESVAVLEEALAAEPGDPAARWLLNIAHMAKGTYPEGVPAELRVVPPPVPPELSVPLFRDVAKELGVDTFDHAGGIVLDDVDGDGLLDVVTSTIDPCGQMRYFRNAGDGTFEDRTERAGLLGQLGGLNLNQADYDGDGRLDIVVFRGAWMGKLYGRQRNSLLHQEPDGTFRDVTREAGMAEEAWPCLTGSWQDYDLDGDLDLYVGCEQFPDQLFRNAGDGTFVDVAPEAGIGNAGRTKGVAWGDYDDDGDPDVYASNLDQPNRLFRNGGDGTFVDVARELGVDVWSSERGGRTFGAWFFDYDNDGRLDLYVSGYGAVLGGVAADYVGLPSEYERLHLFRNLGGRFRDVAPDLGLARVQLPMGANYGDVNNDGWLDVYLGTGKPGFEFLIPNTLFMNLEGERFADVTAAARVGHLQKGHGIGFGDVDNDGDQDVFAQMGGFLKADAFHDALFENTGPAGRWVTLCLAGQGANRFGVGARVRVDVERASGGRRSVHALVGSGGGFGASTLRQEIGLGDAVRIECVEVRWPASAERQVATDVPLDSFVEIAEGRPGHRVLELPRVRLGARD